MDTNFPLNNLELDIDSSLPLYQQLANRLSEYIASGRLMPGTKLPPERELASLFQVSRTTAINTYRLLEKKGLVQMRVGSGTYVSESSADADSNPSPFWHQLMTPYTPNFSAVLLKDMVANINGENVISFAGGIPDPAHYPLTDLFDHLPAPDPQAFSHIPTEGYPPLRKQLVEWFAEIGIRTQFSNLLVDAGSQQGLYLLCKAFLAPGDYVVVEMPAYMGAIQAFHHAEAKLLPFYLESFSLAALEDCFRRYHPKLMYVNPTFQNPTGKCMSLWEREALLQIAARYRVLLIEDNAYGLLHYGELPPPSLKALDTQGIVIHLATFSKILFPGLRLGALVAHEAVIQRLAMEKQLIDLHSANPSQWLLYHFLAAGSLNPHLERIRSVYQRRRDRMVKALKTYCSSFLDFQIPEGGFYIWCHTKFPFNTGRLMQEAAKNGIAFVPGDVFYLQQENHSSLRLCFVTQSEKNIVEGIKRLAQVLTVLSLDHGIPPVRSSHQPIV